MTESPGTGSGVPKNSSIKDELLDELRKQDNLKKELLKELQPTDWASSFSRFIQHPALLLIIGFLLTSGLGAGVTYFWQKRERIEGQRQAAHKLEMEKKHAIAGDILKSVAETTTAVEDLIKLYLDGEPDKVVRGQMETERLQYWQSTSRDWRVISKVLQQETKDHFEDQAAQNLFKDIISKRFDIGLAVAAHRFKIKQWHWKVPDAEKEPFKKDLRNTLKLKEDMLENMRSLIATLNQEIKKDESK